MMKINEVELKEQIEEIISYGAMYCEEIDITTQKVISVLEPLFLAVKELKP